MTSSLEKAAKALAASFYEEETLEDPRAYSGYENADDYANQTWEHWLPQARAVLLAVREPEEITGTLINHCGNRLDAIDTFTAMINEILKEKK